MIVLAAHGWMLRLDPDRGGTVTAAEFQGVPVLHPLGESGFQGGCFVMAPFANRIDGGRFEVAGRSLQTPVNRPQEGMAIHGTARDQRWQVIEFANDHAVIRLESADPGSPWRYALTQDVRLLAAGPRIGLEITNTGPAAMPFGMGLHPWFPKPPGTTLEFQSGGAHRRDPRGLPLRETDPHPEFAEAPVTLDRLPWFDGCFGGWNPRHATIRWPDATLTLTADGALRHLHVYNPDDRPVFCAEPVSHLPDAINRPGLGPQAQMTLLAPGAAMSGGMSLSMEASPEVRP